MKWTTTDQGEPLFLQQTTDETPSTVRRLCEVTDAVVEKILEAHKRGARITPKQARSMIRSGMYYGWHIAHGEATVDQRSSLARAVKKRRVVANAKHEQFRKAWNAALKSGREVSVTQLARELGVSRSVAYRALAGG